MQYIIVNPYEHPENEYIMLQCEAIRKAGYIPVSQDGNIIKSSFVLYNWMENIDGKYKLLIIVKKIFRILQFKLLRKKIIWVMHNKQPHEKNYKYGLFMMKVLALFSDKIMILCDETIKSLKSITKSKVIHKKVYKVPLISYESIIGQAVEAPIGGKLNLLLFGQIKRYKGVDILLEAMKDKYLQNNTIVNIVGKCSDKEYLNEINKKIDMLPNVSFQNNFIDLMELKRIVADTHLMVLPMDVRSSLNSSAAMMAFSLRRTVICPNIGTIKEYKDQDYIYTYDYSTTEEHVKKLREILIMTINDLKNDSLCLRKKGNKVFEVTHKNNSIDTVALAIKKMLES